MISSAVSCSNIYATHILRRAGGRAGRRADNYKDHLYLTDAQQSDDFISSSATMNWPYWLKIKWRDWSRTGDLTLLEVKMRPMTWHEGKYHDVDFRVTCTHM